MIFSVACLIHFKTNSIINKLENIKINEKNVKLVHIQNFPCHPSNNRTSEIFEIIHMDNDSLLEGFNNKINIITIINFNNNINIK